LFVVGGSRWPAHEPPVFQVPLLPFSGAEKSWLNFLELSQWRFPRTVAIAGSYILIVISYINHSSLLFIITMQLTPLPYLPVMRGRKTPEEEIAFRKLSTTQFPIFHRLQGPLKSFLDVHGFVQAVADHEIVSSAHEPHHTHSFNSMPYYPEITK
jgi:hypothetical protein